MSRAKAERIITEELIRLGWRGTGVQFPMPVTHGSVAVRIHRITKKSGYVYYQFRHYVDGKRETKSC